VQAITPCEDGIQIDPDLCNACESCIDVCAFNAIFLDEESGVMISCDRCGDDPECVKFCYPGALSLSTDQPSGF